MVFPHSLLGISLLVFVILHRRSITRMRRLMNRFELINTHLGINLRGIEVFMAQQLLDKPYVRPVLQHVRGTGVSE